MSLTLARPYARAAFALAQEEGKLADWSEALGFATTVASDARVAALLRHPQLSANDAVALLFRNGAGDVVQRFLGVLADAKRLPELPDIAALFDELRAEAEKVVKAKITSAATLDGAEIEKIKAALQKRFARDVEIETSVDASLIGGAVIDAGDVVIDGSLKGKLERLQTALAT